MKKLLLLFSALALLFCAGIAFGYGEGEDAVPAEAVEEEAPAVEPEPVAGTRTGAGA